jgi:hypothetical protein
MTFGNSDYNQTTPRNIQPITNNMLTNIALNAVVLALSALVATAAPTGIHKRGATIFNTCANKNQVALTFDGERFHVVARASLILLVVSDGPYIYEQNIAGRLDASGSKGTFFFNGNSKQFVPKQR